MIFVQIPPCRIDDIRRVVTTDGLVIRRISSCIYRRKLTVRRDRRERREAIRINLREGKRRNFHHRFRQRPGVP